MADKIKNKSVGIRIGTLARNAYTYIDKHWSWKLELKGLQILKTAYLYIFIGEVNEFQPNQARG
jgi:hypothetical protein